MIIQTFQPEEVIKQIESDNIAFSKPDFSIWSANIDENIKSTLNWEFSNAYDWMVEKMNEKIINSKQPKYPFWGWAWSGDNDSKYIDIDLHNEYKDSYLITLNKLDNDLVLSDFNLWHYVLNYWPIVTSKEEEIFFDRFERIKELNFYENKPLFSQEHHRMILKTWDKIFNLKNDKDYFTSALNLKELEYLEVEVLEKILTQACFWNIKKEEILKIEKI